MLCLIPSVKKLSVYEGRLARKAVCYTGTDLDSRVLSAVRKLPAAKNMQDAAAQKIPPMASLLHSAITIPEMVISPPARVIIRDGK